MLKNITPSLPEHGKIKAGTRGEEVISKGGKRFRLPEKLNHYIITTTERDPKTELLMLEKDLMDNLKKNKALVDSKGNLTSIPIRLLYNDINLNLFYRNACYVGGKCVCSSINEKTAKTRDGREKDCPCEQIEYDYQGSAGKCKVNGKLSVIIDGADVVGACHVLRTTSKNTIESLIGGMTLIQARTGGLLAFLPLHLVLKPMTVTTADGKIRTVYISSIVFRGTLEDLYTKALVMAKEKAQFLITMDNVEEQARKIQASSIESPREAKDMQAEFYPDNDGSDIQNGEVVEKAEPEKTKLDLAKESIKKEPEKESEQLEEKTDVDQTDNNAETDNKEPEQVADIQMVEKSQKEEMVKLKKKHKIATGAAWEKLLKPFEVKTANDLTFDQAEKFIASLKANPT